MARRLRDFIPGFSYHLTQRGNRKENTFLEDSDRRIYMRLLAEHCAEQRVRIWSYSLMGNHVHHIAVPEKDRALSIAFQRIHGEYARYFNAKYAKTGHLWQGRFKACVLDEVHLWNAVRYVERNPVRAGIVNRAEDYRWSSAAAHCGLKDDPVLSPGLPFLDSISDWSEWLAEEEKTVYLDLIRERTRTGRPCATDDFARKWEGLTGRPALRRKPGPPRKSTTESPEPPPPAQERLGFE